MKSFHLCIASSAYPPLPHGGHGTRNQGLAEGLAALGHKVTVIGVPPRNRAPKRREHTWQNGVRVVRLPPAPTWTRWRGSMWWERLLLWKEIRRLHRLDPISLVDTVDAFGWMPFGAPAGLPLTVRFAATTLLYDNLMGVAGDKEIHRWERRTLRAATAWYAPSQWAADQTRKLVPESNRACKVIYNAVDDQLFSPDPTIPVEPGLIVFANGIEPRKGVAELLTAFCSIADRYPHITLALYGSDKETDAEGRKYLDLFSGELPAKIRDRIRFHGVVDRNTTLLRSLRRAEFCIYPSHLETFGFAPVEAMACGKAVIYSNTAAGPEVIEDKVSGLLCNPHDPNDIADKMSMLLDSKELSALLGHNARKRVLENFSRDSWVEKNLDFFKHVTSTV